MTNKDKYHQFIQHHHLPLFFQPWWLDAVCFNSSTWNVAISYNKNKEIDGVLPYCITHKMGASFIVHPQLTPFLGPWIKPKPHNNLHKKYSYEQKIIQQLLNQIPPTATTYFKMAPSLPNWLPFQWNTYKTKPYIDQFIPQQTEEVLYNNLKKDTKYAIRKAQANVDIILEDNPQLFYEIQQHTFKRQQLQTPFSYEFFLRIYNTCQQHQQGQLYFAKDKQTGEYLSAAYLCWDHDTAYALATGTTANGRKSNANTLLKWVRIQWAMNNGKNFSFCGSSLPGVFALNQGFNTLPQTGMITYKAKNKWWELLMHWRNWI